MKIVELSDIHWGNRACNEQAVLNILADKTSSPLFEADALVLNGDTLDSLNSIRYAGWKGLSLIAWWSVRLQVVVLPGNHDPLIQEILKGLLPDAKFPGSYCIIDNVLYTHGHQDPITRDPWDRYLRGYAGPTSFGNWVEDGLQMTGKLGVKVAVSCHRMRRWLFNVKRQVRNAAIKFARIAGIQGIVVGHTHYAEQVERDGICYINSGSLCQNVNTYVVSDNGKIKLRYWA